MRVLVVVNKSNPKAHDASLLLSAFLHSQGIEHRICTSRDIPDTWDCLWEGEPDEFPAPIDADGDPMSSDLAVVLGGDGTILKTARIVSPVGVPILGINFGHLGFLANSSEPGVVAMVAAALSGDMTLETRSNLSVQVICDDADDGSENTIELFALNEAVVARGASGRIVDFEVSVSGDRIAAMRGDGLIVSTATGSTAYALSAGGPLVSPGFPGLVVVPVMPHTLRSRAIVTEGHDVVEVVLDKEQPREDVAMFVDGEAVALPSPMDAVIVRRGDRPTKLLRYKQESFYAQASRVFF